MEAKKKLRIMVTTGYPYDELLSEGMMARIKSIDELLSSIGEVTYVSAGIRGNLSYPHTRMIRKGTREIKLNFFIHQLTVFIQALRADVIYVHSITTYALMIIPLLIFSSKVILDVHGVVPEETLMSNKKALAIFYGLIEKIAFKRTRNIVVVTNSMKEHFIKKYGIFRSRFIYIPIYEKEIELKSNFNERPRIIYAGGIQKWQNFDVIREMVYRFQENYDFEIYIPAHFRSKVEEIFKGCRVVIDSLSKEELFHRYRNGDIGVLFRDDIVVNNVANPTKLNEYLSFGLVPLMMTRNVGDFDSAGYYSLSYPVDLIGGISMDEVKIMSEENSRIHYLQKEMFFKGIEELASLIENARIRGKEGL